MRKTQVLLVERDDLCAKRIESALVEASGGVINVARVFQANEALVWLDWNAADAIVASIDAERAWPDSIPSLIELAQAPVLMLWRAGQWDLVRSCLDVGASDHVTIDDLTPTAAHRIAAHANAHAQRAQLTELDTTIERQRQLSHGIGVPPGADLLRERDAATFATCDREYTELLRGYLDFLCTAARKPRREVVVLIEQLANAWAGPWDLAELHHRALEAIARRVPPERAHALMMESRILALEMVGELATRYRERARGADALSG
ncbi:MAG: hypothetical protein AAF628_22090 [Planctomycetota bacterium]